MNRRQFLMGTAALFAAPAIVKAENLMKIVAPENRIAKIIPGNWMFDGKTIKYIGPRDGYCTVVELHRWLQDQADQPPGDNLLDITDPTPSTRFTDHIIRLENGWHVEQKGIQHLHDGSLIQTVNGEEQIYDGVINYEAAFKAAVQQARRM